MLLPHGQALVGWQAVDRALDVKDGVDPAHGLGGQWRAGELGQVKQLAAPVGPAAGLGDRSRLSLGVVKVVEPRVGVSLQNAGILSQVLVGVLAPAVGRVVEQRRGRGRSGERAVVAHVGPQSTDGSLAPSQHGHGGIITVQPLCRQHVSADQRHQRRQRGGDGTDPVGQGRGVEFDALAGERLALPVQRQVLGELCVQDRRQQLGPGPATGDGVERRRRLGDGLTRPAGELLPDRSNDLPPAWHQFQRLGDILAQLGQLALAARAGGRAGEHHALARQMRG